MPINTDKKKANIISLLLKSVLGILFAVLILTMLPAAMPETKAELPGQSTVEDEQTVFSPVTPYMIVIYSERDAKGAETAEYTELLFSKRIKANYIIISDEDFLALDAKTLALYDSAPSLTVTLGITSLLDESYLEIIKRLGTEGIEVNGDFKQINIISASLDRVKEEIDNLEEALHYHGSYITDESMFYTDARPKAETDLTPDIISNGNVNILTFSHIDKNSYTLRAIEGIVAEKKPDLVIFNGNVDGSAKTRRELADMWQSVSDILNKTETPWCFIPGEISGELSRITVCEVISSFEGCIRQIDGKTSGSFSLTVADEEGIITASIYVADTFDENSILCDKIESDIILLARASDHKRAIIGVFPALSSQILSSANDLPEDHASDKLSDVYDTLIAAGAEFFVCAADPVSSSVIKYDGGMLALCGSIGFDSLGVGGRFELNNSLRGAVTLTIKSRRAGYTDCLLGFFTAAELGLNER